MREVNKSHNHTLAKKIVHNYLDNEDANKHHVDPYTIPIKKVSENSYRVLLIEDNLFAQQVSQYHLNKLGGQVDLAINVKSALSLITQSSYDLILMDISLPDGDGRDVTRAIRDGEQSLNRGTPVIVITAHSLANEEKSCFEAGIDCIFPKPLTSTMLLTIWSTFVEPDENEICQDDIVPMTQVIDMSQGIKILGSEEDAKAILNDLIDLLPEERQAITLAYESQQWSELKQLIHKLYSGISYCGTPRLQASCRIMENLLKRDHHNNLAQIELAYQQLLKEIAAVLASD